LPEVPLAADDNLRRAPLPSVGQPRGTHLSTTGDIIIRTIWKVFVFLMRRKWIGTMRSCHGALWQYLLPSVVLDTSSFATGGAPSRIVRQWRHICVGCRSPRS